MSNERDPKNSGMTGASRQPPATDSMPETQAEAGTLGGGPASGESGALDGQPGAAAMPSVEG